MHKMIKKKRCFKFIFNFRQHQKIDKEISLAQQTSYWISAPDEEFKGIVLEGLKQIEIDQDGCLTFSIFSEGVVPFSKPCSTYLYAICSVLQ